MSKQEKQSLPHVVWDRLFAIVIDYVLFYIFSAFVA